MSDPAKNHADEDHFHAVDSHDSVLDRDGPHGLLDERHHERRQSVAAGSALIARLENALADWDQAYEDVMVDWPTEIDSKGERKAKGMTEERLKIATRNRMRERTQELPEIARWRLRAAVGFRSEED